MKLSMVTRKYRRRDLDLACLAVGGGGTYGERATNGGLGHGVISSTIPAQEQGVRSPYGAGMRKVSAPAFSDMPALAMRRRPDEEKDAGLER
jgi:hypothetical protein